MRRLVHTLPTAAVTAAALAFATVLAGCPLTAMTGSGTSHALHAVVDDPPLPFSRLRAVAHVEQIRRGKRIRGRVYVLLERPATIRFDAMSPADTPLSILTADSERFRLLDVGAGVLYTGPPESCNVARLISIPMDPRSVVDILTGTPPLIEAAERDVEFRPKGYHLLTLRSPGSGLKQTVQLVSGMLGTTAIRSVVWRGETVLYDLRFRERHPVGKEGPALPHRIQFTMPGEGTMVTLEYTKIDLDPDLPEDAFTLDPPASIPRRHMSCDGPE